MSVTRKEIEDILAIAIDDECADGNNIRQDEVWMIKKKFDRLMEDLSDQANTEEDEDSTDRDDIEDNGHADQD